MESSAKNAEPIHERIPKITEKEVRGERKRRMIRILEDANRKKELVAFPNIEEASDGR